MLYDIQFHHFGNNMLDDILWFLRVVDQGSFTKVAQIHKTTVSKVSKRIQVLEEQLQMVLLQRSTRQLHLTERGEVLYQKCGLLQDIANSVLNMSQKSDTEVTGTLRVTLPISLGHEVITPLLGNFYRKYPNIILDIRYQNRAVDLINEGYDVAIICGQPQRSTQIIRKIGNWRDVICASPYYLKNYGKPKTIITLQQHQCVVRSHGDNIQSVWHLTNNKDKHRIKVNYAISVNTPQDLKKLALQGEGIIKIAHYLVKEALQKGDLIQILPDYYDESGDIYFEIPNNKYIPLKTRVFMDFITNQFRL